LNPLYLIAEIHPHPEKLVEAKQAFDELMVATLQEPGCLLYDLVVEENSDTWIMLEKWASVEAWDLHMETAHVKSMNDLAPSISRTATILRFFSPVGA